MKPMKSKVAKFTCGSIAAVVCATLCNSLAVAAQVPATPVATTPASSAAPEVRVQVVAETSATMGAPMSGRLSQFPLRDGERFKQGQVLARFVCAEKEGALAHARAVYDGRKTVNDSKQRLRALGTSSEVEYKVAASDEEEAAADVKTAQTLVDNCIVVAPFSGRVSSVYTHNFQFLQVGAPMLDVLSDRNLDLEMIVPSMWLSWLKPGSTFNVAIDETGKTYPATLTRLSGKVDAVSRSVKVYGHIENPPDTLLPGMSGRALFVLSAGASVAARQ
ncbi:RND family efflux transporter MFP subunit [Caballeronia udeis]|uniref:RND family efflux transporter MFP subunit n=2 Tax=Caballeronia udeis TaxID=1232866 RepID=A0A158JR97_9BURK|nr:RND family efflux transporter MFP subunit [Caballeronia udeis]